jgi:hypothetical protein
MIRLVSSTIIPRPMLYDEPPSNRLVRHHMMHFAYMIREIFDGIQQKAAEFKWVKLILMRNNVPMDVFEMIKPYLICKGQFELYPPSSISSEQCVPQKKYYVTESKLYRLGLMPVEAVLEIRYWILIYRAYYTNRHLNRAFMEHLKNVYLRFTYKHIEYSNIELEELLDYWL